MKELYLEVVLNNPLKQSFTYTVPENLQQEAQIGKRVYVSFGRRLKEEQAYIVDVHSNKPKYKCKDIIYFVDNEPVFDLKTLELARWIAEYYICSLGEALSLFVPKNLESNQITKNEINKKPLLDLNKEQQNAVNIISQTIKANIYKSYLLFGVTGSGKTEVYKYLSKIVTDTGKQAIILVPEISLTPQTIQRFQSAFGNRIAVLHSKLNAREKAFNWKQIKNNEVDIILGPRSAIFAPVQKPGIIIIDEEHETSYKSGDTPRYHARQIAFKLAQREKIPVVLGTATPSIETMFHALNGDLEVIYLKQRHSAHQIQKMTCVDMRTEKSRSFVGEELFKKLVDRLHKKEQCIIFLNKRGYSPLLLCKDCGEAVKCPHCDIALTYHQKKNRMLCHYCEYSILPTKSCPNCNGNEIQLMGYGTERIEEELIEHFPNANIARMDFDSTRKKGSHEDILNDFKEGKIDILVGTQMIAKGLHFPNVTLVGVVLADLSLHIPDFRASEKTFSLLAQVSGRAGRGDLEGEVLIQTYLPSHYVIQTALKQDYEAFYYKELEERLTYGYPPYTRFVRLLVRGINEDKVIEKIKALFDKIIDRPHKDVEILGPAPAPLAKINKNHRWQILLKGKKISALRDLAVLSQGFLNKESGIYLEIDIDPQSMM